MKEGRTMSRRKKGEEREEQARPREWMELERRGGRMGRAHFVGLLQSLDLRRERIHQDTNVGIFERPHGGKNSRDWSERKEEGGRGGAVVERESDGELRSPSAAGRWSWRA